MGEYTFEELGLPHTPGLKRYMDRLAKAKLTRNNFNSNPEGLLRFLESTLGAEYLYYLIEEDRLKPADVLGALRGRYQKSLIMRENRIIQIASLAAAGILTANTARHARDTLEWHKKPSTQKAYVKAWTQT